MSAKLKVLLIEDSKVDAELIIQTLKSGGFDIYSERVTTPDGLKRAITQKPWHIVISDYSLPCFNGLMALSIIRATQLDVPFLLVSGTVGEDIAVEAMKAGAQDYIMKDNLARLFPAVQRELAEAERRRDQRKREVQYKQTEEKLKQLKRFFSPQIGDLIISGKLEDPFKWHRKTVTVVFIDLRHFTSFVEMSEPANVMAVLQEYYAEVAKLVRRFEGTIGHVAGDGIMVVFNDPIEVWKHAENAVAMALEGRALLNSLCVQWRQRGAVLDFGIGLASGPATIGGIGAESCWDYSVIGMVVNLASRLCDEAQNGQILIPQDFLASITDFAQAEPIGEINLKGFSRSPLVYNISRKIAKAA